MNRTNRTPHPGPLPASGERGLLCALVLLLAVSISASEGAAKYFDGVTLVDQSGRTVRLHDDVIKDHVVVMHTFFASCTASCPLMMNTLRVVQERFGDRVRLVSITVDPAKDTPAVLKDYAARIQARPGWLFLTGTPQQVELALQKIGQYAEQPDAHMNLFVAGNDRTGLWKKIHGLAKADEVAEAVKGVVEDP